MTPEPGAGGKLRVKAYYKDYAGIKVVVTGATSKAMTITVKKQQHTSITRLGRPGPYILDGLGIIKRDSVFLKKQGVLIFLKTEIRKIKVIENFSD